MPRQNTDVVRTPDYSPDVSSWTYHLWVTCWITWTTGLSWVCQRLLWVRSHSGPRYTLWAAARTHGDCCRSRLKQSASAQAHALGIWCWQMGSRHTRYQSGSIKKQLWKVIRIQSFQWVNSQTFHWVEFSLITLMSQEQITNDYWIIRLIFTTNMKKQPNCNNFKKCHFKHCAWIQMNNSLVLLSPLLIIVSERRGNTAGRFWVQLWVTLYGVCMFSTFLCGFSPGNSGFLPLTKNIKCTYLETLNSTRCEWYMCPVMDWWRKLP